MGLIINMDKKYYIPKTCLSKDGNLININYNPTDLYHFNLGSVTYRLYKTLKGAKIAIGKINPI